jgi:hypothetical protein
MAQFRGGDKFKKKLNEIVAKIGSGKSVKVGYFPESSYPNGTKVALVAAVQNFGAPSRGIPPRPFFTNFIQDGQKEWPKVVSASLKVHNYDTAAALAYVGQELEGELRQSIQNTNSPPLKEATIKRKGSSKPLVGTHGLLLSGIASRVEK